MRPSGDTARGFVFDDFVGKQVVHVSATSFQSGAERVSMALAFVTHEITMITWRRAYVAAIWLVEVPLAANSRKGEFDRNEACWVRTGPWLRRLHIFPTVP